MTDSINTDTNVDTDTNTNTASINVTPVTKPATKPATKAKPVIAIVCCQKDVDGHLAQTVYHKYIDVINYYGGAPILLPYSVAESDSFASVMPMVDGILLTGSYSNVAPVHYGAAHHEDKQDVNRDNLSFALLKFATANQLPLLAICRGLQEMNVYFGGTLYPDWRKVDTFFEPHLEDGSLPLEAQYQPVHQVNLQQGGKLAAFNTAWRVNSLHKQAIHRLGAGLLIEALAPDNLIEAISLPTHPFMVGVQWHPEFDYIEDAMSNFIFTEFIQHAQQNKAS